MHARSSDQIRHASSLSTLGNAPLPLHRKSFKSLGDLATDEYGCEPSGSDSCPLVSDSVGTTQTELNSESLSTTYAHQVSDDVNEAKPLDSDQNNHGVVTLSGITDKLENCYINSSVTKPDTTSEPAISERDNDDSLIEQADNSAIALHNRASAEGYSDKRLSVPQQPVELNNSLSSSTDSLDNDIDQSSNDESDSNDILLRTRRRCRRDPREVLSCDDDHGYSEDDFIDTERERPDVDHAAEENVDNSSTVADKCDSEDHTAPTENTEKPTSEAPEELDADQDKNNPAYVPRGGRFFMHDCRGDDVDAVGQPEVKKRSDTKQWRHDMFSYYSQVPRSSKELVRRYGYNIRMVSPKDNVEHKGDSTADQDESCFGHSSDNPNALTDTHNNNRGGRHSRNSHMPSGDAYSSGNSETVGRYSYPNKSSFNNPRRGRFSSTNPQVSEPMNQDEHRGYQRGRFPRQSGAPRKASNFQTFNERPRRGQYHHGEGNAVLSERRGRTYRRVRGENTKRFDSKGHMESNSHFLQDQSFPPICCNNESHGNTECHSCQTTCPDNDSNSSHHNFASPADSAKSFNRYSQPYTRRGKTFHEPTTAPSKRYSTQRQNMSIRDPQHDSHYTTESNYNAFSQQNDQTQARHCFGDNYSTDYYHPEAYDQSVDSTMFYSDSHTAAYTAVESSTRLQSQNDARCYVFPPPSRGSRHHNGQNAFRAGRPSRRNVYERNAPPFQQTSEQTEQYYDATQDEMYATSEPRPILGHHSGRLSGSKPSHAAGSSRSQYRPSRFSATDHYTYDRSHTSAH